MTAPHEVEENLEDHIGPEIPDPWDDEEQEDWPMNPTTPSSSAGEPTDG